MSALKGKSLPPLLTDEEAERFVEQADLTEYDLSGGTRLSAYEFQTKTASVHMRMPEAQLAEIKAEASRRGLPYQRFMRELLQRGLNALKAS